jgi:hypothetical protein
MTFALPIGQFKFLSEREIAESDFTFHSYPLVPESMIVTDHTLSPYCKSLSKHYVEYNKLLPNLRDKTKYVLHPSVGLKVTKIHRVRQLAQSDFIYFIYTLYILLRKQKFQVCLSLS